MSKTLQEMMAEEEKRAGLPAGALASIHQQETGGRKEYLDDPTKPHYPTGYTKNGVKSSAFGPFGILESTGAKPGYGVAPLKNKTLPEQVRFAADYLAGRVKAAGSFHAGLAGYGEGDRYANQVIRRMGGTVPPVPAVAPRPDLEAPVTFDWPLVPTAKNPTGVGGAPAETWAQKTDARARLIDASQATTVALAATNEQSQAQTQANIDEAVAVQSKRDSTGISEVFQTARRDPRMQPMFTLLDHFNKEEEVTPDGWTYNDNRDQIEAGYSDEERAYLRENVKGPQSLEAAKAQLAMRRDLDNTYANASGFAGFAGQMAGGALDPLGFAMGLGVGKALQGVGIGSRALANAGRTQAAAGSFLLENALANVSVEVMQDALGEVKGTGDYAMAAVTGAAMGLPFVRGATRMDANEAARRLANDLKGKATREQVEAIAKEATETGITDPAILARRVEEKEIESITQGISMQNGVRDQIVPNHIVEEQRALARGEEAPTESGPPEMIGPPDVPTLTDVYSPAVKELPAMTAKSLLEKVDTEDARWLLSVLPESKWGTPIKFEGEQPFYMDSGNERIILPESTGRQLSSLDAYDKSIIAHEVTHLATARAMQDVVEGVATPSQVKAATELQRIFDDFTIAFGNHKDYGVQYALKDIDEFMAQLRSDPTTQAALRSMGTGKNNLWTRLVAAIADLLGIKRDNQFDAAVDALGRLITAPSKLEATPGFKKWFSGSKVVDDAGNPRMVFHGTSSDIESFSKSALGTNTGANSARQGFFFTSSPVVASGYAMSAASRRSSRLHRLQAGMDTEAAQAELDAYFLERKEGSQYVDGTSVPTGSNVMPMYLDIKNPYVHDMQGKSSGTGINKYIEAAKAAGHDGVILKNVDDSIRRKGVMHIKEVSDVFVAFEPTQVKSVLGNSGDFSSTDARILKGPVAPQQQTAFNLRFSKALHEHAKVFMDKNPIDTKRLKVLTDKIGGMSDGLVMAASKNPIVQMMASLVAETTTGAAGRKPSVAIRANLLNKKFIGNAIPEYTSNFDVWANANNIGVWDRMVGGEGARRFGREVYTETLNRRQAGYVPNPDQSIVKAADALEGVFDRARIGQVSAGTLGADNLPTISRGYMPQALDGAKLQTLDAQQLQAFHDALSAQFQSRLGWDKRFADTFAPYYTDRVRLRAMGSKQFDMQSAGGGSNDVIRDTLEHMANDPRMRDHAGATGAALKGMGHTKKRLDLDLQGGFGDGMQLMDMYVTDPLALARIYARRNAGSVAFTESGVLGSQGINSLREAASRTFDGSPAATPAELEAFDRVVAEIMGNQVECAVVSAGATNLALAVQVSKLGSLVFTQAAETMQLIHALGVASALNGISTLPRMLGEVGRLKKGGASGNHILTSIETYGGEFGTESYKMVAPLDPPDNALNQYMDQSGLVTRLLRGAGHLQSKISGFRGLMAAQHRMAAEQIVMKAARFIRDGGEDVALRDMGFTPEVVAAMRSDLQNVAKFDSNGKLTSFDLTQVSDPATAEAFVQAVHRGVSQIIQGTFPGERNKWFHNDYLKTMLQLRTFGLTATEKQWGRSASNHGTMYTVGMLLGQMALALPIHLARVHAASIGRGDRDEFLKDNLNPVALARATMNYSSLSGLMGDVMDVGTGIWSGWGGEESRELLGGRQQATGIANVVPALGMVDQGLKALQGKSTMYNAVKQLPFANLWYMVPLINILKED